MSNNSALSTQHSSLRILVLHGPNLNLTGEREPEVYGAATLAEIDGDLQRQGEALGIEVECFQSNHEGELIDRIHEARRRCDAIIINPGALTHYSFACRTPCGRSACRWSRCT